MGSQSMGNWVNNGPWVAVTTGVIVANLIPVPHNRYSSSTPLEQSPRSPNNCRLTAWCLSASQVQHVSSHSGHHQYTGRIVGVLPSTIPNTIARHIPWGIAHHGVISLPPPASSSSPPISFNHSRLVSLTALIISIITSPFNNGCNVNCRRYHQRRGSQCPAPLSIGWRSGHRHARSKCVSECSNGGVKSFAMRLIDQCLWHGHAARIKALHTYWNNGYQCHHAQSPVSHRRPNTNVRHSVINWPRSHVTLLPPRSSTVYWVISYRPNGREVIAQNIVTLPFSSAAWSYRWSSIVISMPRRPHQ